MNTIKTFVLTLAIAVTLSGIARADEEEYTVGNYNILQMTEDDVKTKPPFRITRVEQKRGALRAYIRTTDTGDSSISNLLVSGKIADVNKSIKNGELKSEFSTLENSQPVTLTLKKTVTCTTKTGTKTKVTTYDLKYSDATPKGCGDATTEYYISAPVTLGTDRDLVIGFEPDFMWFVEKN